MCHRPTTNAGSIGTNHPAITRLRLLVSVRNVAEADAAINGGADVIDVKEPDNGPMGMASPKVIQQIAAHTAGRRPVSAALGELIDSADLSCLSGTGEPVQYVKIALARAPKDWRTQLAHQFEKAGPAQPVAVAYADYGQAAAPPIDDVLAWACQPDCYPEPAAFLIDTAMKDGSGLFDHLDEQSLCHYMDRARQAGLLVALAGALEGATFLQAVELGPDIVAVRGAACRGNNRKSTVDTDRVRDLVAVIAAHRK